MIPLRPIRNFYYPPGAYSRGYQADVCRELGVSHAEAYCLMNYASKDGNYREQLWNSRDGVTPFVIHGEGEVEMQHTDWQMDVCVPFFVPPVGLRVFIDLTEAATRAYTERRVERDWDHGEYPMSRRFATKDEAIRDLVAARMAQEGQPDIVVVTTELQSEFARKANQRLPVFKA